jgi:HNH endonuclease
VRLTFCAACGSGKDLQHHRLVTRAKGGSEDERNLITLCGGCHLKLHKQQAAGRRGTAPLIEQARQRDAHVLPVIRDLEARGPLTLPEIADALNARGVKTTRDAWWYPASVSRLLARNGLPTRACEGAGRAMTLINEAAPLDERSSGLARPRPGGLMVLSSGLCRAVIGPRKRPKV